MPTNKLSFIRHENDVELLQQIEGADRMTNNLVVNSDDCFLEAGIHMKTFLF